MGCGARSCQTDGVKGFPTLRGSLLRGQSSCCARPTYDKQARCARCIRSGPLFALLASFFSLSDRLLVVRPKTRDQRREEVPMPCYWCAAREVYPFSPPQKRGAAVAEIRSWKVDDSQSREKEPWSRTLCCSVSPPTTEMMCVSTHLRLSLWSSTAMAGSSESSDTQRNAKQAKMCRQPSACAHGQGFVHTRALQKKTFRVSTGTTREAARRSPTRPRASRQAQNKWREGENSYSACLFREFAETKEDLGQNLQWPARRGSYDA